MPIFRKNEEPHAGSGLDKPDPKTLKEKIADGVKAVLPSDKKDQNAADPTATPG